MSKLIVLAIALPIYLVSVVIAVASYRDTGVTIGFLRRLVFRALPYGIAGIAPLFLANSRDDWLAIILEATFYMVLTWVLVWGVKKQWYGEQSGN